MIHEECPTSGDCGYLNSCIEDFCVHNSIFPMSWYTGLVYMISPIMIGVGMVGGLGGGVLKGPILMMLLDYNIVEATMISYCILFGGCIVNTVLIMRTSHPYDKDRPIVNYEIAMILNCSISLGSYIGSTLNMFMAAFYETLFQELFLLIIIPYLWKKGMKEKAKRFSSKVGSIENIEKYHISYQETVNQARDSAPFQSLLRRHQSFFPKRKLIVIAMFFVVTQIIMTGGQQFRGIIPTPECFDIKYFLIILLIIVNIPMTYIVYKVGKEEDELKNEISLFAGERYFNQKVFIFLYTTGFTAGFISGLIGLGAGMVMIPVMLHIGVHPRVASSTSGFTYVFIGMTNVMKLVSDNALDMSVILWFTFIAFIGGSVFAKLGYYIVDRFKISYIVIFFVVGLAILNLIAGVQYIILQSAIFGFDSLLEFEIKC